MRQQSALEYLRHGQTPFFRLPAADLSKGAAMYDGADAVLLGVPFDGGTSYQPGARLAPYEIRRVSALVGGWHPVHEIDVFEKLAVIDGGNVVCPPFDDAGVRALIEQETSAVLAANAAPILVGGDHSLTYPALRAIAKKHGPVAVVHVDAHFDTSGPEVWGNAFHHGTPFRHALSEGLIAKHSLYQIGIRGPWKDADERKFAASFGARLFQAELVAERGISSVMREVRDAIGSHPVYLSIDVDGVDPAFAPGTGTPVPNGLTSREVFTILRSLAGCSVVGGDVVEVAPALDHADMTVTLASHLVFDMLALLARR